MGSSPAIYKNMVIAASDSGNFYVIGSTVDTDPPQVQSTNPMASATDVDISQVVSVVFNEPILTSTLTTSTLKLKDSIGNPVAGQVSYDMGSNTAYFTPELPLNKEETYTFTVTPGITDLQDNSLDGNKNGIAEGVGVDEYEFSFGTSLFVSPIINNIPKLKPVEDVEYHYNLSSFISDEDTPKEELVITEDSSYAILDGFELTMLYPEGVLSDDINVTVSDNKFTVFQQIHVEVTPVNDPPVLKNVNKLLLTEDVSYFVNMTGYLEDVDSPYSDFTMVDDSKYTEIIGLEINFTYPEGVTSDMVNVTIYDEKYNVYTDIEVEIAPVNDPPVIKDIPVVAVKEDQSYYLDLGPFVSDIDTSKELLELVVDSEFITISNHVLVLLYPDSIIYDQVEVSVFDGEHYGVTTMEVLVELVNDPPVIIQVNSPTEGAEFEHDETITFSADVFDPDLKFGDELTFQWYDLGKGSISQTQNATDITLTPGEHMITFTVKDKEGARASVNLNITVLEPPEPEPNTDPDPNSDPDTDPNTDPDTDPNTNPATDPTNDEKTDDGSETKGSKKETSSAVDSTQLIIIIVVVIVILVLLVLFGVVIRKKKGKSTSQPEIDGPTINQGTIQFYNQGQVAPPQTQPQLQFNPPSPYGQMQYPIQPQAPTQGPTQEFGNNYNNDQQQYPSQTFIPAQEFQATQQAMSPQAQQAQLTTQAPGNIVNETMAKTEPTDEPAEFNIYLPEPEND
jgi:hypothetical protein